MRHPTTDAMELQMDALLRSAAGFEPEREAPFDLVERAMQRATRQVAVVRVQRPLVALLWGSAAGAAAASAAAAFLMSSPSATPNDPLQTRQAAFGALTPGYRVTTEVEPAEPTPAGPRRALRVRPTAPRDHNEADRSPALAASWQTQDVERTLEQDVRPALRVQFDELGRPIDLQAGLLETLTVSETACGPSDADAAGTNDDTEDNPGASRSKEANLPSKEE
jgi:hypothetical protein